MTSSFFRESGEGILVEVYVQPKASRNEVAGVHEGRLKVRLTAPPVEGAANKECGKFFAKTFELSGSEVEIIKGSKSRRKTVLLRGLSSESFQNKLKEKGIL